MESKRQKRFAGVIQQDLSDIFFREGNTWFPGEMVTVTHVRMTPDLGIARVYLSFLNVERSEEIIDSIRYRTREIRYKLGKKVKHQTKSIPELEFFVDNSIQRAAEMDKLFEEINKQHKD